MIGESILLHVALRCSRLRLVDASWSNVGDNGVEALVQNVDRFVVAFYVCKMKTLISMFKVYDFLIYGQENFARKSYV